MPVRGEDRAKTDKNTPAPEGESRHRDLLIIVLVALLLRLAVITVGHTYRITPRRDHFQFGWEMGRLARSIATGRSFSSPTDLDSGPSAWAAPVYPYILGGIFRLFGVYSAASAWVILTFNGIFAALTSLTLYGIGARVYGMDVARRAAWTWAVFPYELYWPTRVVWETSLSTFLLSLVLWLTLRMRDRTPRRRDWIFYGFLWGVIALTNTALVSMLPFFLLWMLYGAGNRRGQFRDAALCLLAAALVVTPWMIRNYAVFGRLLLIRDNLPLELHMANNERSDGLWTRMEHPGNDPAAMQEFRRLGEMGFMDQKAGEVRQFILDNPRKFAWFTLERTFYFWAAPPQATIMGGYDLIIARHTGFLLAAALAWGGLVITIRHRKHAAFLLASLMFFYPLPYYMVNPFPRYKAPIEPEMILLIVYLFWEARKVRLQWRLWDA
ncbi:MAG: glycosyltransferase family 39 protein [Acidobacteriales bacterium]|nr:glycosyltransferase family 39 protein [Terriglobales bacterium]